MNNPLITIAMPIYNVEKYVEDTLMSIMNQTYKNIEILIVDDCSTDNSLNIVTSFFLKYKIHKYDIIKHLHNRGPGAARNTAIINASGKYIYFIDSDDIITNDCISLLYNEIFISNADFVEASYKEIDCLTSKCIKKNKFKKCYLHDNDSVIEHFFNYAYFTSINSWNKLFRIDFLRKNNIYFMPYIYYEDRLFNLKVRTIANSCVIIPNITYIYRNRSESITHSLKNYTQKNIKDMTTTIKIEKKYLMKFIYFKYFDNIIASYCLSCFYFAKAFENKNKKNDIHNYIDELLEYPLSIKEMLLIVKHKKILHYFCYMLSHCKYPLKVFILKVV